ncbi:MAG: hypothetical protein ACR2NP_16860 [Pirellulaceae bacterium]
MNDQSTKIRLLAFGALGLCVLLGGCLGPWGIRKNRPQYNEAIKLTSEQELLLNLVRLRYDEVPFFLSLDSVASQMALTPEAGFEGEADSGKVRYFGKGNLSFEDRPTVTYTPQDNADFVQSLLTPVDIENLALLARLGWDNERVFRLIIKQMNGVENAVLAGGPVPESVPVYAEFHEIARLLSELRDRNFTDVAVIEQPSVVATARGVEKPSGDQIVRAAESSLSIDATGNAVQVTQPDRQLMATLNPQTIMTPEIQQFCEMLRLRPGLPEYRIVSSSSGHFDAINSLEGIDEIRVSTRAPLEIMFYLSKGVVVPGEHLECGLAASTANYDGTPYNWHDIVGDLICIQVCDKKPEARLAVKYRDHWFYIDDRDQVSKRTLFMLIAIMDVSRVEGRGEKPVLTLPL